MKRQRSRGRGKPVNNNPNRAYESVGPDMKVRGSAQTILERYQQVGRDAMSSGDRVLAENYLQHAEHYLRLIKTIMPNFIPRSELSIAGLPSDSDEDDFDNNDVDGEDNSEEATEGQAREQRPQQEMRDNRNRNFDRSDRNGERQNSDRTQEDGNGGRYNNRNDRGNRNRNRYRSDYRNNGEAGQENDSGRQNDHQSSEHQQLHSSDQAVESNSEMPQSENREETRQARPTRTRGPRGSKVVSKESSPPTGFGDELPAFLAAPSPIIADAD